MQRRIRKIKVLGYPFAGGQGKSGVELTPSWLQNQCWFKNLANNSSSKIPIEYEEIQVSSGKSNSFTPEDYLTMSSAEESGLSDDEQ
jgi:arginase